MVSAEHTGRMSWRKKQKGLGSKEQHHRVFPVFTFRASKDNIAVFIIMAQPTWRIEGTKKGAIDIRVEKRPLGKKVTIISNVRGRGAAGPGELITLLRRALGVGGTAENTRVILQGDCSARVAQYLVANYPTRLKGVARAIKNPQRSGAGVVSYDAPKQRKKPRWGSDVYRGAYEGHQRVAKREEWVGCMVCR